MADALVGLVITGATTGAAATVIVSVDEVVPISLVAVSVTTEVPAVVGVPVMAPVDVFSVKPAGRPVAE